MLGMTMYPISEDLNRIFIGLAPLFDSFFGCQNNNLLRPDELSWKGTEKVKVGIAFGDLRSERGSVYNHDVERTVSASRYCSQNSR